MTVRLPNIKRYRRAFILGFYLSIAYLFYYGFSPPDNYRNYNDVNTHFSIINDLESGVEAALKQAVREFVLPSGHRVTLTIDPDLQIFVNNIFLKYDLPIGAVVAVEPASGKVIAMTGYYAGKGLAIEPNLRARYPAASLVKLITASAALEELDFSPATKISYRGKLYKVSRLDLKTPESSRYQRMTLTEAIAKSANNVFGKLTANYIGKERFIKYLDKFGFSRSIPFDLYIEESSAEVPENGIELAKTGAGFGKVMISPVHAAMIGASVANNGVMMKPFIIESIRDQRGNVLYSAQMESLGNTIEPETARKLIRMMRKTPVSGTMRKVFSQRRWRKLVEKFDIAGKTGSITWGPPRIRYEWSLGIAPAREPSICFVSLTGNKDLWHIKSTYIVREALAKFFKYDYKKIAKKNIKRKKRYKKRRN